MTSTLSMPLTVTRPSQTVRSIARMARPVLCVTLLLVLMFALSTGHHAASPAQMVGGFSDAGCGVAVGLSIVGGAALILGTGGFGAALALSAGLHIALAACS